MWSNFRTYNVLLCGIFSLEKRKLVNKEKKIVAMGHYGSVYKYYLRLSLLGYKSASVSCLFNSQPWPSKILYGGGVD